VAFLPGAPGPHPRLLAWRHGHHGLLIGAALATALFAVVWKKPFLLLADALVIPGALLMGLGRIGNFSTVRSSAA
jgi:prolipoprotein diacylglyceryltransferase